MGYRDAVKQARAELDVARDALRAREAKLSSEAESQLPDGLRSRLKELRGALTPVGDSMDGIRDAEQALEKYGRALTESVDLIAQIRGAKARGEDVRPRDPRRWPRGLRRFASVAGGIALLVWLPGWLVEQGDEAADECITDYEERSATIGQDCRQRAWLWPAALFAWERDAAFEAMEDIERRAFNHDVERSAAAPPERAAHDALAKAVLARDAWPESRRVETAFRLGAFEVLAASDQAASGPEGFYAARAIVDIERANALAAERGQRGALAELQLRRGAWLCLYGDVSAGREILLEALADESLPDAEKEHVAVAAYACAPDAGDASIGAHLSFERRRALAIQDPAWQAGRRLAIARGWMTDTEGKSGVFRMTPVALSVMYGGLSLHEVLALLPPSQGQDVPPSAITFPDVERLLTRWSPLTMTELPAPVEPLLGAADRLVQMVAEAKDNPAMHGAAAKPTALVDASTESLDVAAWTNRANPEATLLRAAWAMRLQAAIELSHRGAHREVLELLIEADAIAPSAFTWLSAGLRHAAGDAKGAVAQLDAFVKRPEYAKLEASDRAMLGLELALARASVGDFDLAVAAARDAHQIAEDEALDTPSAAESRWLYAALALRAGAPPPPPGDDAWASALEGEHERRTFRSQASFYGAQGFARVAVAAPYAMGHIAGEGGDVETWLNRLMQRMFGQGGSVGLRTTLLARAEAAAWRGDAEAETLWRERVARLEAKIVDGRTVVLARHAGL